ncbi:cobyrinate a,c-diamide synthase [Salirhabdus salicampi]|uniref:cobyrinate a,c-diamide synthase n=1 Tax=Salirhabdus salicampi TaxID=476102 RepID=UPI0020C32257|nr:cobyrinate a,c-diamide synthase [Salirhabdus salicampi]MCP8618108.1 cobyrinate a,c-diamide synthase [Salirhabdus salicampi]
MKRFMVAGTHTGVGKTTITTGLMSAFKQKGLTVQGYKCGPDFIDPTFHSVVTGRKSHNLDSYMLREQTIRNIVSKYSKDVDLSIIEGMMGLYDGVSFLSDEGSSAHISEVTETPILLIVEAGQKARSIAAEVLGFQQMNPRLKIFGVIISKVSSVTYYELLKGAIESVCNTKVFGYLPFHSSFKLPERHLGLIPAVGDSDWDDTVHQISKTLVQTVDIQSIYDYLNTPPIPSAKSNYEIQSTVKIAVAYDAAFHFYYEENFEILRQHGAECVYFSPLKGEIIPSDCHGLYIGGGFPEHFASQFSNKVKLDIKDRVEAGLPVIAECGGFMFLAKELIDGQGNKFDMVGILPAIARMNEQLQAIRYIELSPSPHNHMISNVHNIKGHEFHYSNMDMLDSLPPAFFASDHSLVGYIYKNVIASYVHLHFASNENIAKQFVRYCKHHNSLQT